MQSSPGAQSSEVGRQTSHGEPLWIGRWLAEPILNRLSAADAESTVTLQPRVMDLLMALAARPEQVVSRQELLALVWGDVVVEEGVLSLAVHKLRKALGDDATDPTVIETVPRRGYRLVAPVADATDGKEEAPAGIALSRGEGSPLTPAIGRSLVWAIALAALIGGGYLVALDSGHRAATASAPGPMSARPLTSWPGVETYPTLSPDGSMLAFAHQPAVEEGGVEETWDLYLKRFGQPGARRLTADSQVESWPAFSPDGRSLAFVRSRAGEAEIVTLSLRHGAVEVVTTLGVQPSVGLTWTPSGKALIFGRAGTEGRPRLVVRNLESGSETDLTDPPSHDLGDGLPVFNQGGSQLAFARGTPSLGVRIMLLNMADRRIRTVASLDHLVTGLAWTPNGHALIYGTVKRDGPRLWSLPLDGEHARPLDLVDPATHPSATAGRLIYVSQIPSQSIRRFSLSESDLVRAWCSSTRTDASPRFSPDGDWVAFRSRRGGGDDLWIASSNGSSPTRLTWLDADSLIDISWSPDGSEIAFSAARDGFFDLYVIDLERRLVRRLSHDRQNETEIAWSADGASIYFSSNRSGRWQVWRLSAAGGDPAQVTDAGGFAPRESQDGRSLTFTREQGGLWQQPVDSSNPAELIPGSQKFPWTDLLYRSWIADAIYFARRGSSDQVELVRFSPSDGTSQLVADLGSLNSLDCSVSPRLDAVLCTEGRQTEADIREAFFEDRPGFV